MPLYAINATNFPLTAGFRLKLRKLLAAIYGNHQFMILCGLEPNRYTDIENVIIHTGISSHIGSQRGLTGHEGGDNTAVRKQNRLPMKR